MSKKKPTDFWADDKPGDQKESEKIERIKYSWIVRGIISVGDDIKEDWLIDSIVKMLGNSIYSCVMISWNIRIIQIKVNYDFVSSRGYILFFYKDTISSALHYYEICTKRIWQSYQ